MNSKQYKLLKDLPWVEAGVVFTQENDDPQFYNYNGGHFVNRIFMDEIIHNHDWFQLIEQKKETQDRFVWDDESALEFARIVLEKNKELPFFHVDTILSNFKKSKQQSPIPSNKGVYVEPIFKFHNTPKEERIEVTVIGNNTAGWVTQIRPSNSSHSIPVSKHPEIKQAIEQVLNNEWDEVYWNQREKMYKELMGNDKTFTQQQLEEAERKAWDAARKIWAKGTVFETYTITSFEDYLKSKQ